MVIYLLAFIAFAAATVIAGIQRAWVIALIAVGLAFTVWPHLHLG